MEKIEGYARDPKMKHRMALIMKELDGFEAGGKLPQKTLVEVTGGSPRSIRRDVRFLRSVHLILPGQKNQPSIKVIEFRDELKSRFPEHWLVKIEDEGEE